MDLSGIISISGRAGLSKIVSQSRSGIIVESLVDGKRFPVHGAERVSSLEDISIYTYEEDVLLSDVFDKMYKHFDGKPGPNHKAPTDELKSTFSEVLPKFDEDRVYNSDIKKVFQWYNLLLDKGILKKEEKTEKKEKTSEKKKQTKAKDAGANKSKKKLAKKSAEPKNAPTKGYENGKRNTPKSQKKG
jgi:hypothetical protein